MLGAGFGMRWRTKNLISCGQSINHNNFLEINAFSSACPILTKPNHISSVVSMAKHNLYFVWWKWTQVFNHSSPKKYLPCIFYLDSWSDLYLFPSPAETHCVVGRSCSQSPKLTVQWVCITSINSLHWFLPWFCPQLLQIIFVDFFSASKKPLPPTPEDNWVSAVMLPLVSALSD